MLTLVREKIIDDLKLLYSFLDSPLADPQTDLCKESFTTLKFNAKSCFFISTSCVARLENGVHSRYGWKEGLCSWRERLTAIGHHWNMLRQWTINSATEPKRRLSFVDYWRRCCCSWLKWRRGGATSVFIAPTGGVLRKRVHYFSLCGTWTDSASIRGYADIPFPFLKYNTCSSKSKSLATSHLMLSIFFRQWPSYRTPFFIFQLFSVQYSRPRVREPTFHPGACMTNVWACNLYDKLALRGVTYGCNSCIMKQESWFLPKLYNENFLSDDHWVTHKSWVQDASRRVCPYANNDSTYNLRISSIHYVNMGSFSTWSQKGLISAQWRSS